jgi:hypothetical protein
VRVLQVDRDPDRLVDGTTFQDIHGTDVAGHHAVRHRTGPGHDDSPAATQYLDRMDLRPIELRQIHDRHSPSISRVCGSTYGAAMPMSGRRRRHSAQFWEAQGGPPRPGA